MRTVRLDLVRVDSFEEFRSLVDKGQVLGCEIVEKLG